MKTKKSSGNKKVLVVGAGFSGLASAFYLLKFGFEVEIIEMAKGPGGLLGTVRGSNGLVESGANGLLNSRLVEDLFADIDCVMVGPKKEARARYIFRDGRPRRWPLTLAESFSAAGLLARYAFARETLKPEPGESLRAWASRTLSPTIGRFAAEAAFQGVYAGDPERLSATLLAGPLFAKKEKPARYFDDPSEEELLEMAPADRKEAELKLKKARKRKLKWRGTVSAEGGMGELIQKLEAHLKTQGVRIRYGQRALPTSQDAEKRPIVVATAFLQARELVEGVDPERARAMAAIPMLPLVSVTGFYRGSSPRNGFGVLFPPSEKRRALGVLFNSCIFDGRVATAADGKDGAQLSSETWILGGALAPGDLLTAADDRILEWIDEERAIAFGTRGERVDAVIVRWPEALPHYTRELEKRLPIYVDNRKNLFLIGNYLGQIGLGRILERASRLPREILENGRWG